MTNVENKCSSKTKIWWAIFGRTFDILSTFLHGIKWSLHSFHLKFHCSKLFFKKVIFNKSTEFINVRHTLNIEFDVRQKYQTEKNWKLWINKMHFKRKDINLVRNKNKKKNLLPYVQYFLVLFSINQTLAHNCDLICYVCNSLQ